MTQHRRHSGWRRFLCENAYRDVWLLVITGFVVYLATISYNAAFTAKRAVAEDTRALCALRIDLEQRARTTREFLAEHPNGTPGIPATALRVSLFNNLHSLRALGPVRCPTRH